eukprot:m.167884 g.167884  ORF g.167884 m.167884 type:complete len:481 (-) comp31479_c0_seq5:584-2026(-)
MESKGDIQHDRAALAEHEPAAVKVTPLPLKPLITLFFMMIACAAVATSPFPFLTFMVQDLGVRPEESAYYVGIIASGRFAGNLSTSWLWGLFADKYGRRPAILLSVGGEVISNVLFGIATSHSIGLCWVCRFLGGALDGAIPISKVYVSEITDDTNNARALAIVVASWGAGLVIGPALGGFLSQIATKYPDHFGGALLAETYPYGIPNFVIASLCFTLTIAGYFFLPESKTSEAMLTLSVPQASASPSKCEKPKKAGCLPVLLQDGTRRTTVMIYVWLSIVAIGYDEMYNVWCATSIEYGGLGYTTDDIGVTHVIFGATHITAQFLVFHRLVERFGVMKLFRLSAWTTVVLYVSLPLVTFVFDPADPEQGPAIWLCVVMIGCVRQASNSSCFIINALFINNSVSRKQRGSFNGLAMTCSASMRALSPTVFGLIFSWSISRPHVFLLSYPLVFVMFAAMMAWLVHLVGRLPKSVITGYQEE